jgi:hypothetical protein
LALHFSDYSFLVHHPVNRDDQHLLAHALASDFTVTWQYYNPDFYMLCFDYRQPEAFLSSKFQDKTKLLDLNHPTTAYNY